MTQPDQVFARIARQYDRINAVMSLGRERVWRKRGVNKLASGVVLDLGCGTGATDFEGRTVVGIDPVPEMLALSRVPARVVGIGEALPFADEAFEGVFSAYVFRNLSSVALTLEEMARVMKPGSLAVVVDLGRPRSGVLGALHRLGTAVVLPLTGLLFAGAPKEYWYLHRSLDSLPQPEAMFTGGPLVLEKVWRAGLFGFVYGAELRKPA